MNNLTVQHLDDSQHLGDSQHLDDVDSAPNSKASRAELCDHMDFPVVLGITLYWTFPHLLIYVQSLRSVSIPEVVCPLCSEVDNQCVERWGDRSR